jgi:hypothetical protein
MDTDEHGFKTGIHSRSLTGSGSLFNSFVSVSIRVHPWLKTKKPATVKDGSRLETIGSD